MAVHIVCKAACTSTDAGSKDVAEAPMPMHKSRACQRLTRLPSEMQIPRSL